MRNLKLIKIFLTSLALLLVVINAHCQTKMTEGKIEYSITIPDSLSNTVLDSSKFNQWIYRFKGNKQRTDYIKPGNDSSAFIYDNKTYDGICLQNKNGIKTATVYIFKQGGSMVRIPSKEPFRYFNDTKIICGYKCYKSKYLFGKDKSILYVYYTKEISTSLPNDLKIQFKDLKGFPMEFNSKIHGREEIFTITKISFEKINDSIFEIPEDYKIKYAEKW